MLQSGGDPQVPHWFDLYSQWLFRVGGFLAAAYFWMVLRHAYRKAGALIANGRLTEEEREAFVRPVALYIGAIWFVPSLIYLLRGAPAIHYQTPGRPNWYFSGVMVGVPLLWLWLGRGAELTAKMGPALAPRVHEAKWTPGRVRFFATLFLGVLVLIGMVNTVGAR